MTKLVTTLNLIIGERPTHVNKAFLGMLYYKKEKARKTKTLEEEKVRKPLETRNVYSSFITNPRSPNLFLWKRFKKLTCTDDWADAVW